MSCPETAPDTLQLQHEDSHQRTANADPPHPQLSLPSVEGKRRGGGEEGRRGEGEEGRRRRGQREFLNLRSRATVEHIKVPTFKILEKAVGYRRGAWETSK